MDSRAVQTKYADSERGVDGFNFFTSFAIVSGVLAVSP
jgi:hypothetical protein